MAPFAKSVIAGTFAGAAPFLWFTILIALNSLPDGLNGDGRFLPNLWFAICPLIVVFPVVFVASAILGLPLTALLRRTKLESAFAYTATGAGLGTLIAGFSAATFVWPYMPGPIWLALPGGFSGGVTGAVWWKTAREPILWPDWQSW